MSPGANFFIASCAILIFSVINLSIGPSINNTTNVNWALLNCEELEHKLDDLKRDNPDLPEAQINQLESSIRMCHNMKAMYNMEFTSFIFNIVIAFVCVLLGLYGLQKETIPKTGYIGIGCGVVGLILTLVYVILNGIVYTNYFFDGIYKVDGDGAFAEYDQKIGGYECFYYKKDDYLAIYAKFCDLIKSQYNYDYDLKKSFENDPAKSGSGCRQVYPDDCILKDYIFGNYTYNNKRCPKLYYKKLYTDYKNYDLSARFLTVLLLSIIILLCYCGLIFSGFMLSKDQS